MNKQSISGFTSGLAVVLFGLALIFGASSAVAGDGSSCGGKKKEGESAVVVSPDLPRV